MRPAFRTAIAVAVLATGASALVAAGGQVRNLIIGEGAEADAVAETMSPAARGELNASRSADRAPRVTGPLLTDLVGAVANAPPDLTDPKNPHSFYFTRAAYSDGWGGFRRGRRSRGSWGTDYPKADNQFITVLKRLASIDVWMHENAVLLDDPDLRRFPFLYALEVGNMSLTDAEVEGLRSYLLAGGFLVIDDFWGSREWANFEYEISRVLPEYPIVEMDLSHDIFHAYYDIDRILQVPCECNVRRGEGNWYEQDGVVPHARGIFNDEGRLLVMINWNTDLGDAWEWAEQPYYPVNMSTYAFKMGLNFIIYAMSH